MSKEFIVLFYYPFDGYRVCSDICGFIPYLDNLLDICWFCWCLQRIIFPLISLFSLIFCFGFLFSFIYFIFKLYIIVLVLPNIKMNCIDFCLHLYYFLPAVCLLFLLCRLLRYIAASNTGLRFFLFSNDINCLSCCVRSVVSDSLGPMDCSLPGSSVFGILQAWILERVAICFSRISSQPRDWSCVSGISCIGRQSLYC